MSVCWTNHHIFITQGHSCIMFNLLLQTEAEYPQITVPQRMVDRLQKQKTKQALAEAITV